MARNSDCLDLWMLLPMTPSPVSRRELPWTFSRAGERISITWFAQMLPIWACVRSQASEMYLGVIPASISVGAKHLTAGPVLKPQHT